MSITYTFFAPAYLPLAPDALSEKTARSFTDRAEVEATLAAHFGHLAWEHDTTRPIARATVVEDDFPYELTVMRFDAATAQPAATDRDDASLVVSMRCSGRVDSASFAQRLCDATGWIAFDDRYYLFQPHRPPVPAGGG